MACGALCVVPCTAGAGDPAGYSGSVDSPRRRGRSSARRPTWGSPASGSRPPELGVRTGGAAARTHVTSPRSAAARSASVRAAASSWLVSLMSCSPLRGFGGRVDTTVLPGVRVRKPTYPRPVVRVQPGACVRRPRRLGDSGPWCTSPTQLDEPRPTPVIAVVGPTATGKSDLALALAQRLDGEVVNADSMQLYRGMDIGTAKLTAAERRRDRAPPARRPGRHRDGQRRRVPAAARADASPLLRARARSRSWSAAPGSTCGRSSTTWSSRRPTRLSARALEAELTTRGLDGAARPAGRRSTRRPPARSRPATAAASSARSRSSSSPAGRSRRPCRPASTCCPP